MSNPSFPAESNRSTATDSTYSYPAASDRGQYRSSPLQELSADLYTTQDSSKVASASSSVKEITNTTSSSRPRPLWANSVDDPQIDERDSIYATTYFPANSPPSSHLRSKSGKSGRINRHELPSGADGQVAVTSRRTVTFETDPPDTSSPSTTPKSSLVQSSPSLRNTPQSIINTSRNDPIALNILPVSLSRAKTVQMGDLEQHEDEQPPSPLGSPIRFSTSPPQFHDRDVNTLEEAEEDERIRYRSWREGKADLRSSKAARRSQSRDEPRVDRKIEAILPKVDPQAKSTRSRKSSQYMGLFKENEANLEQRKATQASSSSRAGTSHLTRGLPAGAISEHPPPDHNCDSSSSTELPTQDVGSPGLTNKIPEALCHSGSKVYAGSGSSSPSGPDLHRKVLLAKAVAFESLRQTSLVKDGDNVSRPFTAEPDSSNVGSDPTVRNHSRSQTLSPATEEDEESEKEHISSATYIPHRQVRPDVSPLLDIARRPKVTRTQSDQVPKHVVEEAEDEVHPGTQSPQEVEISLKSQGQEQLWHGAMNNAAAITESPPEYASSQDFEGASSASGFESLDESAASTTEYDSEEDAVATSPTTPKATLPDRKTHRAREPMSAVPLKPFRHQVGGHNTVFQFSRKTICKKMNNRENVFYEVVEKHHPELLDFMPRYIGVLNVTFSKAPKRKREDTAAKIGQDSQMAQASSANSGTDTGSTNTQPRIVSHSQQSMSVPQVIFEHNRHIIPDNLFRVPSTNHDGTQPNTDQRGLRRLSHSRPLNPIESISRDSSPRPHMKTWGSTRVNRRLQEQVLREVFAPPLIHRHRHHTRHPLSTGEAGMQPASLSSTNPLLSYQRSISDTQHLLPNASYTTDDSSDTALVGAPLNLSRTAPAEEPEYLEQRPLSSGQLTKSIMKSVRRRHSGSGLRRRPIDVVAGVRSGLEFHEEDGYGADQEDEVFAMDKEESLPPPHSTPEQRSNDTTDGDVKAMLSAKQTLQDSTVAPSQSDARVEMFILLEDLTARMEKPCVLDLKMGTRQYGVEADEQKQRSQRRKCQMTTSRQLGVRVCGMQVWNVKTDSYLFEDKYFGRDLKAGAEFQSALTRFFFDGLGYTSATRYIPIILDQLTKLERIVRDLPGYRLYASSLLIIYDRAAAEDHSAENSSAPPSPPDNLTMTSPPKLERATSGPPLPVSSMPSSRSRKMHTTCPIKIKIVDFANCVTKEDASRLEQATIPPRDANGVDRGYLRGLRTLKVYFQRIWKEVGDVGWTERGEGEGLEAEVRTGTWNDSATAWDDAGDVSV